jgi:hypothetical protein
MSPAKTGGATAIAAEAASKNFLAEFSLVAGRLLIIASTRFGLPLWVNCGHSDVYRIGNVVGSCARRNKSYDPAACTFVGNDSLRHSCP